MFTLRHAALGALLAATAVSLGAQQASPTSSTPVSDASPGYTTLAAFALAAPVVLDATITSSTRIKGAEAAGAAQGTQRFYVEAAASALLKGPRDVPAVLGWLIDAPLDARGHAPKLKKQRVIAFARPVSGKPGQLQLIAPNAQMSWTPALDTRVRGIIREVIAPDAPPAITGIGNAFHVPGSLPGESETQIFLKTETGRPVSLSILRRPGEQPRWSVALSEIVDDAAKPPARDTLLWYRLACGLPDRLPDSSVTALQPADAEAAQADFRLVLDALGSCETGKAAG